MIIESKLIEDLLKLIEKEEKNKTHSILIVDKIKKELVARKTH